MAVYAVQGKLGTGKSKFCVWMAKQAMFYGRRAAGNLDINIEKLSPRKRGNYCRIPDKPTAEDLDALGHGNPGSYDESRNGVLLLDELGTWLNSRSFQDKARAHLLDWLIHARKKGWDVYLIVQDVVMIDKQVREALVEYSCKCIRMDKVKVPFVGWLIAYIGELLNLTFDTDRFRKWGYLPFFHMVVARIGEGQSAVIADRWTYIGTHLHDAYDTRQIFSSSYPHGTHSVLPPWDWSPPRSRLLDWLRKQRSYLAGVGVARVPPKPKPHIVRLIERLPDRDQRVRWMRRYLSLGTTGGPQSAE